METECDFLSTQCDKINLEIGKQSFAQDGHKTDADLTPAKAINQIQVRIISLS